MEQVEIRLVVLNWDRKDRTQEKVVVGWGGGVALGVDNETQVK